MDAFSLSNLKARNEKSLFRSCGTEAENPHVLPISNQVIQECDRNLLEGCGDETENRVSEEESAGHWPVHLSEHLGNYGIRSVRASVHSDKSADLKGSLGGRQLSHPTLILIHPMLTKAPEYKTHSWKQGDMPMKGLPEGTGQKYRQFYPAPSSKLAAEFSAIGISLLRNAFHFGRFNPSRPHRQPADTPPSFPSPPSVPLPPHHQSLHQSQLTIPRQIRLPRPVRFSSVSLPLPFTSPASSSPSSPPESSSNPAPSEGAETPSSNPGPSSLPKPPQSESPSQQPSQIPSRGGSNSLPGVPSVGDGPIPSSGPAFMGQVFTMCDSSRRGLLGVKAAEPPQLAPAWRVVMKPLLKMFGLDLPLLMKTLQQQLEGPMFHFYFKKEDAARYIQRLGMTDPNFPVPMVGSCPLDEAYKYFKSKPPLFQFVADAQQVHTARWLLRRAKGPQAARSFQGVPVFTAANLTIAMATPGGIRWFTPYFFSKQQLDSLIGHSVDHFYQELLQMRRLQRHGQLPEGGEGGGELPEDNPDSLLDPPEVQELMEEMGHGGGHLESALVKAAEVLSQDCVDSVLLGNRWGRRIAGLQPTFQVVVDSFERRTALAEAAAALETGGYKKFKAAWLQSNGHLGSEDLLRAAGQANGEVRGADGGKDEAGTATGTEEGPADGRPRHPAGEGGWVSLSEGEEGAQSRAGRGSGAKKGAAMWQKPLAWLEKAWREIDPFRDEREMGADGGLEDWDEDEGEGSSGSSRPQSSGEPSLGGAAGGEEVEPWQRLQPKMTMLGVAVQGPAGSLTDATLQQAMVAAARDFEEKVRKGESTASEHGPLFIADLGDPTEVFGTEAKEPDAGWGSDEAE